MTFFVKKDAFFIVGVLLFALILAVCVFLFSKEGQVCNIYIDSVLYKSFDTNKESTYALQNGVVVVCDGKGKVYVESSDCPDKVCVNTGVVSKAGQWIACIPNKTLIKIEGKKSLDAVN